MSPSKVSVEPLDRLHEVEKSEHAQLHLVELEYLLELHGSPAEKVLYLLTLVVAVELLSHHSREQGEAPGPMLSHTLFEQSRRLFGPHPL